MLSPTVISAAKEHALTQYPKEACGYVFNGDYVAADNIAENPTETFKMATTPKLLDATMILHSHPQTSLIDTSCPSADDMRGQIATAVPWAIIDCDGTTAKDPYVFGDHLAKEPLYDAAGQIISYEFHHGVRDCYTAIRRWYWARKSILLPEFPRDVRWWENEGESLYVNGFEQAGFVRVSLRELQDGDVVFGKVGGREVRAVNHGGIYLDNTADGKGLIYHHLPGRLARREPAGPWVNRASFAARYAHAN